MDEGGINKEFCDYLAREYGKWVDFTEGKGERVQVPFFPIASFERKVLSEFFSDFVVSVLGKEANLLTIVSEKRKQVYFLFEEVRDGRVLNRQVLLGSSTSEIKGFLEKKGMKIKLVKEVELNVLRQVFEINSAFDRNGNKRQYLVSLLGVLLKALKNNEISFSPEPAPLKGFKKVLSNLNVDYGMLEVWNNYLTTVELRCKSGRLFLDLGTPARISADKEFLFELIHMSSSLSDLSSFFETVYKQGLAGLKEKRVSIKPFSFLWSYLIYFSESRVEKISRKLQFVLSLFGNPLRILVVTENQAFLLVFLDGRLHSIEDIKMKKGSSLKETWLAASKKYGFVHLSFRIKEEVLKRASPLAFPGLIKQGAFEYFPPNEFVQKLNEMGALDLFMKVVYPFVQE
ncbi:hypothetical protein HY991_03390 [Candidatus Micrarchaeota archaeon]|nr:hypothetical protein [Candidatus Micrarchaeota archaeon]